MGNKANRRETTETNAKVFSLWFIQKRLTILKISSILWSIKEKKSREATRDMARFFDPYWLHSSVKKPRHISSHRQPPSSWSCKMFGEDNDNITAVTFLICHILGIPVVPPSFITNSSFLS